VVSVVSFVQYVRVAHNDSIVVSREYNQYLTVDVTGLNASSAPDFTRVFANLRPGDGKECDLVGTPSQPACFKKGTLPTTGWDPRIASLDGATKALTRNSGSGNKQSLDTDTVTYLNTWDGHPARWSGIVDGSGNGTGLGQVAEWDGTHATFCNFQGKYAIDRSFGGSGDADLPDMLAEVYPGFRWTKTDVWGYCLGDQPIVVIPMTRQHYFENRTTDGYAGIVTVQGDNGHVKLTYIAHPKTGDYPGPIYPSSLVDAQVDQVSWLDGRRGHDDYGFGFAPISSDVQAGNVSDYLLRDTVTGRLVWVTPLTYANSTSNLIVAYAVEYADQAPNGPLNRLTLYVLAQDDPRRINIDNMESDARTWFLAAEPSFLSNGTGGKLLEFTPVGGNIWRAYGEINGVVRRLLDFDATRHTPPKLTQVDTPTVTPLTPSSNLNCNHPGNQSDVIQCIKQLTGQLVPSDSSGGASTPSH